MKKFAPAALAFALLLSACSTSTDTNMEDDTMMDDDTAMEDDAMMDHNADDSMNDDGTEVNAEAEGSVDL